MVPFPHILSIIETDAVGLLIYLMIIGVGLLFWFVAIAVLVRLMRQAWLYERKMVFLELTPLAHTDKTPEAVRQFFTDLHGFYTIRSALDRFWGLNVSFSVEVVGTRAAGIRYILCVPAELKDNIMRTVHSFDADMQVSQVEDYLATRTGDRVVEFGLQSPYYPLAQFESYEESDPAAYLLAAFDGLQPDEVVALQLVLTPTRVRGAERLARRIMHHHEQMDSLGKRPGSVGRTLIGGMNGALFGLAELIEEAVHGISGAGIQKDDGIARHRKYVAEGIRPSRQIGPLEGELASEVSEKLNQRLYAVDMRLYVAGGYKDSRVDGFRKALNVYRTPYQEIGKRAEPRITLRYRKYLMVNRMPNVLKSTGSILSASEVADLYHFPGTVSNDVIKKLSKKLAVPKDIRNRADADSFDVVFGEGSYRSERIPVGLTADERERHVFIVGGTGNGKSTLMKYAITQDIRNGKGVAVVDPHGELAQEILDYIPKNRIKDVIYFNPSDLEYPIGLNVLEIPEGLEGDELLNAKDFIAETVVSIMRKTFSDEGGGGHRIEYVLRNAVLTALTVPDATIFTVYDLLLDAKYRRKIVRKLEEDWLRSFWENEFSKAGGFQQIKMMAGVTSKIGRYRSSLSAGRILSQPKSTINFDEILDGKILICNFAKGLIGEDTSEVMGIAVLAELQLAAYRRIRKRQADRKPFYAYVDEFQNFATPSFVEMLSEARKYKLFLTMAEQTTSQQDDPRIVNTILANAGTIVCFKTNSLADEKQLLHLFEPYLSKGQLANLPAYAFYAKLSGGLEPQEPLSGRTVLVDNPGKKKAAEVVVRASRTNYARKHTS